jgi:NAD(P)-dependent dehydrogenase (short-subunit alcohol dehydrogenase family)
MLAKHLPKYLTSRTFTNSFAAARATGGWPAEQSWTMAIRGLAETLAVDLAPIRVNVVGPGVVQTEIFDGLGDEGKEALWKVQREGGTLTEEVAQPESCAEAYLWLMRDRSAMGAQVYSHAGATSHSWDLM